MYYHAHVGELAGLHQASGVNLAVIGDSVTISVKQNLWCQGL
ncbi:hypothetical protein RintRC_3709 [Richelia intracellularis]|nr:hypothetical protein RintRC_3709 [Richelia intracellularis]